MVDTKVHQGLMWNTAFKFFLDANKEVRADLTVLHCRVGKADDASAKTWFANWDAGLSLGLSF